MNIVEELLAYDSAEVERAKGVVKMPLVRFGGKEFKFPIQSIDARYASELQEETMEITLEDEEMDVKIKNTYETKIKTIIAACPTVFDNKQLRDHYGVETNKQLVEKLLEGGEMDKLKKEIDKLSKSEIKVTELDEDEVKN